MIRRFRSHSWWLLLLVAGPSSGCGSKSDMQKVVVSGSVSFNGEAVANGDVMFYPMPGTKGPVSGAAIKNGAYIARAKGGVPVGEHLVRISGFRAPASGVVDDMREIVGNSGQRVQYLPEKFNEKSELQVTIPGDEAEMTLDFKLTE